MTAAEGESSVGRARRLPWWAYLVAILPVVAITGASLWLDEGNSALKAVQPSLGRWWATLWSEGGSDLQMPLYMIWLWAWEKVAGSSEIALRLANAPWLWLGQFSLLRVAGRRAIPLALAAGLYPFLWFYLNEARPYAMQYAGSCLVLAALSRLAEGDWEPSMGWVGACGLVVLAGSSLLGVPWAGAALLAAVVLGWKQPITWRQLWLPGLVGGVLFCGLGWFYWRTLQMGARASGTGGTDWATCGFAAYELLGFAGVGPGRLWLREAGLAGLKHSAPLLGLGILTWCPLLAAAGRVLRRREPRFWLALSLGIGLPLGFLGFIGVTMHFRLLGRHLTPLAPLLLVLVAVGAERLWQSGRWWARGSLALFFGFWALSAGLLRVDPRHAKEDYRSAAGAARRELANGGVVWWAADVATARYYGISPNEPGLRFPWAGPPAEPVPDLLVLSNRVDVYDAAGSLRSLIARVPLHEEERLPGFTIWSR